MILKLNIKIRNIIKILNFTENRRKIKILLKAKIKPEKLRKMRITIQKKILQNITHKIIETQCLTGDILLRIKIVRIRHGKRH